MSLSLQDDDNSGLLSRDEFKAGTSFIFQDELFDDEIDALFNAMDVDGSGAVSLEELQVAFAIAARSYKHKDFPEHCGGYDEAHCPSSPLT